MSSTTSPAPNLTPTLSWRDWRGRARYAAPAGAIFETRGIYTSITSCGHLIGAFTTLRDAAAALPSAVSS